MHHMSHKVRTYKCAHANESYVTHGTYIQMCTHKWIICPHTVHIYTCAHTNASHVHTQYMYTHVHAQMHHTSQICVLRVHDIEKRRLIGSPKLQIIFHKRALKYRSLLRKTTYKHKGSYESSPPCIAKLYGARCGARSNNMPHDLFQYIVWLQRTLQGLQHTLQHTLQHIDQKYCARFIWILRKIWREISCANIFNSTCWNVSCPYYSIVVGVAAEDVIIRRKMYRVAEMHRTPSVAGLFPQKSH